jgi:MFS family permease
LRTNRIPRGVWLLGLASLFTDAATEMVYPLLPVFLSRALGAGALSLGIIEGVAEAVNSGLKVLSGYASDRVPQRRPLIIAGYAISSAVRPFIALATIWQHVLLIRAVDRTGKGIRGAPRDALLARFASSTDRGRIFGFHRAMDHAGAIVGPLVATGILFLAPGEYRLVFTLTIIPGALAVALLFFVPERDASVATTTGAAPLVLHPAPRRFEPLPRTLVTFLAILLVFSLGNSADVFLLLRASEALGSGTYIPLLWAAIHVVKASLSTWGGMLSDRLGRKPVIIAGWVMFAVVYIGFAVTDSPGAIVAWFLLYGAYFALTEGAEKALVADLAPVSAHGRAFGYYNAALGVGALLASVGFGFLYERFGAPTAFGVGAGLSAVAAALLVSLRIDVRGGVQAAGRSGRDRGVL